MENVNKTNHVIHWIVIYPDLLEIYCLVMNKQHFYICFNFLLFFLTSLSSGAFCFQCSYIFCSAICRIRTVLTLLPLSTFVLVCTHTMQIKNRHTCMYSGCVCMWIHAMNHLCFEQEGNCLSLQATLFELSFFVRKTFS